MITNGPIMAVSFLTRIVHIDLGKAIPSASFRGFQISRLDVEFTEKAMPLVRKVSEDM
jgi:hypothetical protein